MTLLDEPTATITIINPSTGEPVTELRGAGPDEVAAAVAAALAALPAWRRRPAAERAAPLREIAARLRERGDELAACNARESGKLLGDARGGVAAAAATIEQYAELGPLHRGRALQGDPLAVDTMRREPRGVVAVLAPYNDPVAVGAQGLAAALVTGNTVVFKPSQRKPGCGALLAEVFAAALPAGVLTVVQGAAATGRALVAHDDVDKIAFTGSTDVGRAIRVATAGSGKKLSLELGGKSPFIVFDDADLDGVVEGVVDAIWFNQGQVCCAGSRLLVHEGVADRLMAKLRARMEKLRVGNPLDKAVDMGAIVAPVQLERIRTLVEQGAQEGATMWQPSWACPTEGSFYPPTLFTDVHPSSTIAQVEIFGPVLVAMTFRTPSEAVAIANNTPYGLAASVWTENINLALDVAPKIKAGVVWINSTNLFDAAAGFGGYRESGFGREGGREGMWEYLKRDSVSGARSSGASRAAPASPGVTEHRAPSTESLPALDRTPKLYVGGKQTRPDSGYSRRIVGADGRVVGEVGEGNRKDIRNAVEAAHKAAAGWGKSTGHLRAQILYYVAENLAARGAELAARIAAMTGASASEAAAEVEASVSRLFTYGAWADKYDGQAHQVPIRGVALAMHEPIGVLGVVCGDASPLLGLVSLVAPAIATGNTTVVVPSERFPLAATDFYSVLDTSDVPGGVVNIVTGPRDQLAQVLAEHDDVEGVWYVGSREGVTAVERASASNMKRTWATWTEPDWSDPVEGEGREFLRAATQVKNVWIPWGE